VTTPGYNISNYNPNEIPSNVFDQNSTTKYNSYGYCNGNISIVSSGCGTNTGLYLMIQRGASLLTAIRFSTANSLPERVPMTITVEGSNQASFASLLSSSGLDSDPGRYSFGMTQIIPSNAVQYNSYRLLIISIRNMSDAIRYSEVLIPEFRRKILELMKLVRIIMITPSVNNTQTQIIFFYFSSIKFIITKT
jgi:hypothetical protein